MKLLSLLLVCISTNLFGQNLTWFESGTTWNYNYYLGLISTENLVASFEVSEQLIINGQACAKIEVTEYGNQTLTPTPFPCISTQPPYYMYESNDSIYYTHGTDTDFKLAYDFGASPDDSWEFIVPVEFNGEYLGTDTFLVTVLSTSTIEIEGMDFKQMQLGYENISMTMHSTMVFNEITVTEFIGASQVFMIPFPQAGYDWVCEGEFSTVLQCYVVPDIMAYSNPDFSGCTVGVHEPNFDETISVFPNPSDGTFCINATESFIGELEVSNVVGETVHRQLLSGEKNTVETSGLSPGTYLLRIQNNEGHKTSKKIVIRL